MREILFIADDLGLDAATNEAIVRAHVEGVLDGAALMMGQPGTEEAVRLAREHPGLRIGFHLHLADSRPCTRERWPWGSSPARAGTAIGLDRRARELARREIATQWQAFSDTGLPCAFVNAHHHLHVHPFVRRELGRVLPAETDGWVRWGEPRFFSPTTLAPLYRLLHRSLQRSRPRSLPLRPSSTLWGIDRTFRMQADEVAAVLPTLGPGLHEFIFHPRRASPPDPDTRCLLELAGREELTDARRD